MWCSSLGSHDLFSFGCHILMKLLTRDGEAYQFQNSDLHHALVKISWLIFNHLDSDDFMRLHVLTLYDLTKRALAQHIQNEISEGNKDYLSLEIE